MNTLAVHPKNNLYLFVEGERAAVDTFQRLHHSLGPRRVPWSQTLTPSPLPRSSFCSERSSPPTVPGVSRLFPAEQAARPSASRRRPLQPLELCLF